MVTRDDLETAIRCAGWRCPECGCNEMRARLDGGDWIPDAGHWQLSRRPGDWCPVLFGGVAAFRCWLDVLESLYLAGLPVPDYGSEIWNSPRLVLTLCRRPFRDIPAPPSERSSLPSRR